MTQHDPMVRLRLMLDHADEAMRLIEDKSRNDLDDDRVLTFALVQLMQIIGQAATHVDDDFRDQYPNIPWSQIVALRNRLIHGYDTINRDILWQILTGDVPQLHKN